MTGHWCNGLGIHLGNLGLGYGVDIFFAISGFLITYILLQSKTNLTGKRKALVIKNFIIRRSLRLFPIYYLFLIVFLIFSLVTGFWIWHKGFGIYYFTYTANFLFYFKGYQSVIFNHVWSLCVEEQFYLFWPWLILFIPLRFLKGVIFLFIVVGIISCVVFKPEIRVLPIANFHTLGIGALLAFLYHYKKEDTSFAFISRHSKSYFMIFFILFICIYVLIGKGMLPSSIDKIASGVKETLLCIVLFLLLLATINEWTGFIGNIFNFSVLKYIGKISYGIYLFHKPIPFLCLFFLKRYNIHINSYVLLFLVFPVIIFSITVFSYKFIETPFLKLKEKFER
jgi:peptidoglycan/LPS O-acetylase OafA/YrhL